jgi:hypothetical protein
VRLHRDAHLPRRRIPRDDGVRVDGTALRERERSEKRQDEKQSHSLRVSQSHRPCEHDL